MFGWRYLKVAPTTYVMQFRGGRVVREGTGLSFFYFAPSSVIVRIPNASVDVPFVFNEVTSDYQDATIQGELTYRVADPTRLSKMLDFSLNNKGTHATDDPDKLKERLVRETQILTRGSTQRRTIRELLVNSDVIVQEVLPGLHGSTTLSNLGIEVLGLSISSVKGTPELTKALQAEARESMLQRADEAIATRRNAAVEQERTIKENELQTEIVMEEKRRKVRETQMDADIAVEQQRAELVDRRVQNQEKESTAQANALRAMLDPLKQIDWRTLTAISTGASNPKSLIAMAFRDLADHAEKIGHLNISPDLLSSLLEPSGHKSH